MSRWDVAPTASLGGLMREYLEAIATTVDGKTLDTYGVHCGHIVKFFEDRPQAVTKAGIAEYGRKRLGSVIRRTVQKERSTLRGFLAWCLERELLSDAIPFPDLPRRATGTPAAPPRKVTPLTPEQARALIGELPQWSSPRGIAEPFPVRARFTVAFETGLRPTTLDKLEAPLHYRKGGSLIYLTDAADKARFGRELPLTARARQALDSVCPRHGLIFGAHDYRYQLEAAAKKALPPELARTFSAYDLRHARATEWAGTGDLRGTAYLLGHKQLTTTNRYLHPSIADAKKVLDSASGTPTSHRRGLVGVTDLTDYSSDSAKERTRTSTGVTPLAPQTTETPDLRVRARDLLESAASGSRVADYVLTDFARDALRESELGRLALGVLDGGMHAPLRAVELARLVLGEVEVRGEKGNGDR